MKYRAKACHKCSRYGDRRRSLGPMSETRCKRYPLGNVCNLWKFTTDHAKYGSAGCSCSNEKPGTLPSTSCFLNLLELMNVLPFSFSARTTSFQLLTCPINTSSTL